VVGDRLDLTQEVGGQQHGAARVGEGPQHRAHPADAGRVEPVGRLVEDEHLRLAEEGVGQAQPLAHPQGVRPGASPGLRRGEPDQVEHRLHAGGGQSHEAGGEGEDLPAAASRVLRGGVQQHTDPAARVGELGERHAQDGAAAGGRGGQPGEHAHRRRLPGPVRAEEAGDAPGTGGEGDGVDDETVAVPFRQVLGCDHGVHSRGGAADGDRSGGSCPSTFRRTPASPRVDRWTRAFPRLCGMQGLASPSAEPATVAAPPYPAPSAPPPLRPWPRTWRYPAALGIALVLWLAAGAAGVPAHGTAGAGDGGARIGAALVLDALLGVLGLGALPLRRSHPRTAGVLTGLLTTVSASAIGAATVALVSVSTWRQWRWVVPVVAVWVAAAICYELVWRPSVFGESFGMGFVVLSGGLAVGVGATCVATGYYVGARRELLSTLQLRAETAEREQAAKAEAARQAERTRIAREMHDVLAHRISLVAMHAGALAYRTDLSREETAAAAGVIRDNAHRALTELREVLGVLRAGHGAGAGSREGDALAEPPPPVLAPVGERL